MPQYLFTVRSQMRNLKLKFHIDSFVKNEIYGIPHTSLQAITKLKENSSIEGHMNSINHSLFAIKLRARFNLDILPYIHAVVLDEEDYREARELISAYVDTLKKKDLKKFLKQARVIKL